MEYDYRSKKIVAVLSSELEIGVALNVIGHLSIALGAHAEKSMLIGRAVLEDASGVKHLGISKYPLIITKVKPGRLKQLIADARRDPNILMADYPAPMLTTGHDDELASALGILDEAQISYFGALLFGPTEAVSSLTGKFTLWR